MKNFLQGNVAAAQSAVKNGLEFFSFYPITPSTEVGEELVKLLPEKKFINAYSEIEVINHLYGASAAGARCMTATSGCGLSLMREGLSYAVGAELPMVIYNVMRFSPGLGGITPSNQDLSLYWAAGHGQSKIPILTPHTVQEIADFIMCAFNIADVLRSPVIVMCDAILGQMYESCEIHQSIAYIKKDWCINNKNFKNTLTSRKVLSYKVGVDEQEEQIKKLIQKEKDQHAVCEFFLNTSGYYPINRSVKSETLVGIGSVGRVIKEAAKILNTGYMIPLLLSPFHSLNVEIENITVVEIGGTQLTEIIKHNFPQAKVNTIMFPHDIPSVEEVIEKCQKLKWN